MQRTKDINNGGQVTQPIDTKKFLSALDKHIFSQPNVTGHDLSLLFNFEEAEKLNIKMLMDDERIKSIYVLHKGESLPKSLGKDVGHLLYESGNILFPETSGKIIVLFISLNTFRRKFSMLFYRKNIRSMLVSDGYHWRKLSMLSFIFRGIIEHVQYKLFNLDVMKILLLMPDTIVKPILKISFPCDSKNKISILRYLKRFMMFIAELKYLRTYDKLSLYADRYILDGDFSPRKILLANNALASGGAERQLVNTSVGLMKHGFNDVEIICNQLSGSVEGLELDFHLIVVKDAGVKVSEVTEFKPGMLDQIYDGDYDYSYFPLINSFPIHLRETIISYHKEFIKRQPEVVHLWQDQTNILAGVAAVLAKVPNIILSTRNISPNNFAYFQPWMREGYRSLLKFSNVRILANSHAGAQSYAAWLGISENTIQVIHNGFDFGPKLNKKEHDEDRFRTQLGIPSGKIVGGIFRFWKEKDPMLWVETAKEITRKIDDVSFLLIGSGPMHEEIQKLAKKHGILDRIFMPGSIDDVTQALKILDVFLLTSTAEGLPNVLIEAQAMSVPVVSTDCGGSSEAVLDGETGWIVFNRDPVELADRVIQALSDKEWLNEAKRKAPEFIQESFGVERMIDETLDCYFPNKQ